MSSSLREVSDRPRYNTAAVVRHAGVPAATFRAWERRYGFPHPHRLAAGQRLYSDRDVIAIRWLHEQTQAGLTISRAVALFRELLAESTRPQERDPARPLSRVADEVQQALLRTDERAADALLAETFALFSVEDVALQVIQRVLVEVGQCWAQGEVDVADEHFITQYLLRRVQGLYTAYDRPLGRQLVVAACAPGEQHEIGLLLVSVFLLRRGYRVRYLGPNLPVGDLASAVARTEPDLICLSAARRETADQLIGETRERLERGQLPDRLAFGGRAFLDHPELKEQVPGPYLGDDAAAAAEVVSSLFESAQH